MNKDYNKCQIDKLDKEDIHDGYLNVSEFLVCPKKSLSFSYYFQDQNDFSKPSKKFKIADYENPIIKSHEFIEEIDFLAEHVMQL